MCMIDIYIFVLMLYEHTGQLYLWFSGVFCGYRWQKLEFPDLNLEVFKTEQEKLFVLISITVC